MPDGARPLVPIIPDVGGWNNGGIVDRGTLNGQSEISESQLTVCAANEPLRFGFGLNRVGALLLHPVVYGEDLLLPFIIQRGPIDGIVSLEAGNAPLDPSISGHTWLGGTGQAVDAWLQAAWAAKGKVYADTLDGIAGGVLRIPPTVTGSILDLAITYRALKCYDPRDGAQDPDDASTWLYTTNPALWLARFLADPYFGRGETMDWDSVATVADVADEVVGGLSRRSGGLMIDTMRSVQDVEETLRAYAACFIVREPGAVRLIADAPAAPVYAFTNQSVSARYVDAGYWDSGYADGDDSLEEDTRANYIAGSVRLQKRKRANSPTVVSVVWTDTSVSPWRAKTWTEKASGVDAGTTPWRGEDVQMPGIQDPGWAKREAIRRLNAYIASDLSASLISTGEAIELRRGDVVTLTDSEGLSAKPFRLAAHKPNDLGLWDESLTEYNAAMYSDATATDSGSPDTSFPLPTSVPPVTGLTLTEELYTTLDKTVRSRLRATWTAPANFPFVVRYLTEFWDGASLVDSSIGSATVYASPALQEGRAYIVKVSAIWATASSAAVQATLTAQGKLLPPPNVASLTINQFGAWVLMSWPRVVDIDAIKRYEIRRWPGGGSWATGAVVDAVDALALRTNGEPAGDWYYGIVAIDSTERPSATPKVVQFTVKADSTAFFLGAYTFTTPTLSYILAYANRDGYARYVTTMGATFGSLFPSAMSTYTDPIDSYHSAGTSSLETEWFDVGVMVGAQWTVTADITDDDGSSSIEIDLSPDGVTGITTYPGPGARGAGRFVRARILTTGAMTIKGLPSITVTADPRTETFAGTSSASGPATITLDGHYFALKDIAVHPSGSGGLLVGLWANFVPHPTSPNTFDVEIYDASNTLVVADFTGTFYGISY